MFKGGDGSVLQHSFCMFVCTKELVYTVCVSTHCVVYSMIVFYAFHRVV